MKARFIPQVPAEVINKIIANKGLYNIILENYPDVLTRRRSEENLTANTTEANVNEPATLAMTLKILRPKKISESEGNKSNKGEVTQDVKEKSSSEIKTVHKSKKTSESEGKTSSKSNNAEETKTHRSKKISDSEGSNNTKTESAKESKENTNIETKAEHRSKKTPDVQGPSIAKFDVIQENIGVTKNTIKDSRRASKPKTTSESETNKTKTDMTRDTTKDVTKPQTTDGNILQKADVFLKQISTDHHYFKDMPLYRNTIMHRGAMMNIPRYKLRAASLPNIYKNSMWSLSTMSDGELVSGNSLEIKS